MLCNDALVVHSLYINYSNVSKSENFMLKVKSFYQTEWFQMQFASWNSRSPTEFKEVLTNRGYGFAFNMLDEGNLFTDK